jgi:hypothetical protein
METAFTPPAGLTLTVLGVGLLLAAILPTCLYLYVEPRGRRQWVAAGDTPSTRRAPWLVRITAWLSFLLGQLALASLVVPVLCGFLVYLQLQLGRGRPVGLTLTVIVGVVALVQALFALRLVPLGVRLLSGDPRTVRRARTSTLFSAAVLGGTLALSWAVAAVPGFVHPWLGVVLVWTALRPVTVYAGLCLFHALLLGRCASALAGRSTPTPT